MNISVDKNGSLLLDPPINMDITGHQLLEIGIMFSHHGETGA